MRFLYGTRPTTAHTHIMRDVAADNIIISGV
jgi:hypothetical protein